MVLRFNDIRFMERLFQCGSPRSRLTIHELLFINFIDQTRQTQMRLFIWDVT